MRPLICFASLLLALPLAPPAQAQGIEADKLVELIEKVVEDAERTRPAARAPRPKAKRKGKKAARGKGKKAARDAEVRREVGRAMNLQEVSVNFVQTPFVECLDFLRDITGLNIVLSPEAKKEHGETEVTLRVKKIKLRSVLNLILDQVSKDLKDGIKHGVLWIGHKDEWKKEKLVLEFYDVSDIVRPRPNFKAPKIGLGKNGVEIE